MDNKIAIIGGGASGLMASIIAQREGVAVDLYEKNTKLGRKLNITGKGRCNVTASCDKEAFFKAIRRNGKFLYSAFSQFDNKSTMAFFENLGVALKIERGERVFPESDKASDITDALVNEAKQLGVHFCLGESIKTISKIADGYLIRSDKGTYAYPAIILATGGASYPVTGSTGDGEGFAKGLGLAFEDFRPALVPLVAQEDFIRELQGVSLKNVRLKLKSSTNKKIGEDFGEMLFTHFGISGPIVLSLSGACSDYWQKEKRKIYAEIDLKPALSHEKLMARIEREVADQPKKMLANIMRRLLPQAMIEPFIEMAALNREKIAIELSKKEKQRIVDTLKSFAFTLTGTRPLKEAIVTTGGVAIKEINPKTMMAKKYEGLFFTGEVIDVDAYTGGYNLQIAFSTGYAAGLGVSAYMKGVDNVRE